MLERGRGNLGSWHLDMPECDISIQKPILKEQIGISIAVLRDGSSLHRKMWSGNANAPIFCYSNLKITFIFTRCCLLTSLVHSFIFPFWFFDFKSLLIRTELFSSACWKFHFKTCLCRPPSLSWRYQQRASNRAASHRLSRARSKQEVAFCRSLHYFAVFPSKLPSSGLHWCSRLCTFCWNIPVISERQAWKRIYHDLCNTC